MADAYKLDRHRNKNQLGPFWPSLHSTNEKESEIATMSSWWFFWMAFMFLFLVSPVTYGWGYRGWGPPYPRYIQRRRGLQAATTGQPADLRHQSWGWGGDFVWVVLIVASGWAFAGLLLL
jgi:hypothetical protein